MPHTLPIDERPGAVNFALAAWVSLMAGVITSLGGFEAVDPLQNGWVRLATLGVTGGLLAVAFRTSSEWLARRLQLGVAVSLLLHTGAAIWLGSVALNSVADPYAEPEQAASTEQSLPPTLAFTPKPAPTDRPEFEQPLETSAVADASPSELHDRRVVETEALAPEALQPELNADTFTALPTEAAEPRVASAQLERPSRDVLTPQLATLEAQAIDTQPSDSTSARDADTLLSTQPATVLRSRPDRSLSRVAPAVPARSLPRLAVADDGPSVRRSTPSDSTQPQIDRQPQVTRSGGRPRGALTPESLPALAELDPVELAPVRTAPAAVAPKSTLAEQPSVSPVGVRRERRTASVASSVTPVLPDFTPARPLPTDTEAGPGVASIAPAIEPTAPRVASAVRPRRAVAPSPAAPIVGASTLPAERAPTPAFANRRKRQEQPAEDNDNQAKPRTEESIELGVRYLLSSQRDDGSWSFRDGVEANGRAGTARAEGAATGLALLALLGAGVDHYDRQDGAAVRAALDFLIDNQRSDGLLFPERGKRADEVRVGEEVWPVARFYSHGVAAIALCEAFGMTGDPTLREPAQRALDYLQATQTPRRGGWRYTPAINADLSVTGWQLMALRSGELAGLEVRPETFRSVRRFVESCRERSGQRVRFCYNPTAPANDPLTSHGRRPGTVMTSVGLLSTLYLGADPRSARLQLGANHLLENLPTDQPIDNGPRVARISTIGNPLRDTYYWYYATQVMFHMGGDYWRAWNDALHPMLIETQVTESSLAGSWDPFKPLPDRWSHFGGRHYVTTMNLLSLEVYYRHLPLYGRAAK